MRVTLECVTLNHGKEFFHFATVKNIFWEYVFVQRVSYRPMNEHDIAFRDSPWQSCKIFEPALGICGVGVALELFSGPKDRLFGSGTESFRIDESSIVMVSENTCIERRDDIQALTGIGAITNNVTEANDSLAPLGLDVSQNCLQCF